LQSDTQKAFAQGSKVVESTDNPTTQLSSIGQETGVILSTNPVPIDKAQRSQSVQPTSGLPLIAASKQQQQISANMGKFKNMAYNRSFILNFDG
jgi:hypothetical protein